MLHPRYSSFTDPDAAAAAVSGAGLRVSLVAPSRRAWHVGEVPVGARACLGFGDMAAAYSGFGAIERGKVLIAWSHGAGQAPWSLNGMTVHPGEVAVLEDGAEYAVLTSLPLRWASALLPAEDWVRLSGTVKPGRTSVAPMAPDVARGARAVADDAIRAAREAAASDGEAWAERIDELVARITQAADGAAALNLRRGSLIARANEFLRAHPAEVLAPAHLCHALGISDRAVRRLFMEHFGMSVGRYLRIRRLNNVHRELRDRTRPAENVTRVAMKHGFFDLGRFAAQYHRVFGELPSRTLVARRRAARR